MHIPFELIAEMSLFDGAISVSTEKLTVLGSGSLPPINILRAALARHTAILPSGMNWFERFGKGITLSFLHTIFHHLSAIHIANVRVIVLSSFQDSPLVLSVGSSESLFFYKFTSL